MISTKPISTMMISTSQIARACLLVLLMISGAGLLLRAQERSASSSSDQPQVSKDSSQNAGSPGRQLAHGSKEAAGQEKDEMEEFKQSASVQWIAKHTDGDLRHAYWLCVVLNFVVIGGVIVWAGRKNLPGLLRDRTAAIQKAMQEAQKASEEARRRLADIESRLMKLDGEIGLMRNAAEKEAAAEEARIQAAAEEEARKIVASAEQEITAAAKAARRQLTAHAADLAVALAQKQIRVDAAADQALVRNFARELGASGNSGKDKN
ncbi:MAG: ATPase [Candidatus Sulfotelmatobacter sp.]